MTLIDTVLICVYLLVITYIGLFTVKPAQTIKEYAVGDKNISTYSLVGTIFATWIGSVALLNTINQGFIVGVSYILVIVGDVINLVVCAYLAKYFHRNFNKAISIGDIMEPSFGLGSRVVGGMISFMVCLCYITAQFKVINLFFEYFFQIPYGFSTILTTIMILAYSTLGGVNSVVKTDKLQLVVILIFVVLLLNNIAPKELNSLPAGKLIFNLTKDFFNQYIGLFVSFMIPLMLPHTIQRILIARDERQCKIAFLLSSGLSLIFYLICIILGIFAFSLNPYLHESKVLLFLLENNLTQGFLGLGFIGVISILISTVDSFMNIASVSLTHDVLKPIFGDQLTSKAEVNLAKISNLFTSFLACVLSIAFDEILEIILYALNLWGPIMSVPIYFLIFDIKVPKATFYVSLLSSCVIIVLWEHKYDGFEELFAFLPATFWSAMIFVNAWLVSKFKNRNNQYL
jgi:SSS family solute:Na+ symporter